MKILAIESSCDETAVAIVEDGRKILTNVVTSSAQMHQKYGGIVPEVAARKQLESMIPVLEEALSCHFRENGNLKDPRVHACLSADRPEDDIFKNIDAIAVSIGPGLIGSLLIGIETAKTLAFALDKPLIPVNHVLAHMYANFIEISDKQKVISDNYSSNPDEIVDEKLTMNSSRFAKSNLAHSNNNIKFPAISLVVSGGHTEIYLMKSINDLKWLGGTIDDAAGECFDKGARILGFGSKGGFAIQNSAKSLPRRQAGRIQNPCLAGRQAESRIKLPRPMMYDKSLNFSFSGLKTALMREVNKYPVITRHPKDDEAIFLISQLSHELQESITDVLVTKTMTAVEKFQAKSILISGGVASNLRLREKFLDVIIKNANIRHPGARSAIGSQANTKILSARQLASLQNDACFQFFAPPPSLCTDNASFIGSCAYFCGKPIDWRKITAIPDLSIEV